MPILVMGSTATVKITVLPKMIYSQLIQLNPLSRGLNH